jgi:lipopolysaccharide/colanic/teichoic acid biosynthesis glycosyltransferase
MSTLPAPRPAPSRRESRPTLRVYHPRISALLQTLPELNEAALSHINVVRWIEGRMPLLHRGGNLSPGYRLTKRLLDIVGALALLVLLGPFMLIIAVMLLITGGAPIFRQTRVGLCGQRFQIYKFRTMRRDAQNLQAAVVNEQSGPVFKNRRDPRITRLGLWLRKFSLDETPQLFNVLRGEMSLVGPRPPVPREVAEYAPRHCLRLSVKPGLTCVWQVSGRCDVEFDDWMGLDEWYVRNQSLRTDVDLLLRTPWSVLTCRGAY